MIFSLDLLAPTGRILLLAGSGYAIYQVVRGEYEFEKAIIGMVVGIVGLAFYMQAFGVLNSIADSLLSFLANHMNKDSLSQQIEAAVKSSETVKQGKLPTTSEMIGQVWRAGVWSVASSIIELIFVLADPLIEVSQKVLLNLILFMYPVGCGLYPIFPKVFYNLSLYAVELSLWRPLLIVVHELTATAGRSVLGKESEDGLKIVAIEIVAAILIFSIPAVTHKVMNGALGGDLGTAGGLANAGRKVYGNVASMVGGVFSR